MWWCASIREDVRESRGAESREKDKNEVRVLTLEELINPYIFIDLKFFFFFKYLHICGSYFILTWPNLP